MCWERGNSQFQKSHFGHVTNYELTHFKKMVQVWKTKSLLFCSRHDPLIVFWRKKSYNFHFHKNDVTWPLSANGLFVLELGKNHWKWKKKVSFWSGALLKKFNAFEDNHKNRQKQTESNENKKLSNFLIIRVDHQIT